MARSHRTKVQGKRRMREVLRAIKHAQRTGRVLLRPPLNDKEGTLQWK